MTEYLTRANELKEEFIQIRRTLHQNPEIGNDLPNTVKLVKEKLQEMGIESQEICKGGLVATLGNPGGKTILLRADMDALPMKENSDFDFASTNEFAHTCGHDMHAAILLGAAKILKENENKLEGYVKLMFQPAEETLSGAQDMVDAGVLKNPDVDAAMAFHVFPGPQAPGCVNYTVGPMAASSDSVRFLITGHGGHGAMPHTTVDPVNIAAKIYEGLQTIVSREVDPAERAVITIGKVAAGDALNIIPQTAEMLGTVRTFNKEVREFVKKRIVEIAQTTAKAFRGTCEVEFIGGTPACINDEKTVLELLEYIKEDAVETTVMPPLMGSEDFSIVAEQVPGAYFALTAGGDEEKYQIYGNHHPKVCFNEDCIPYGMAMFANCAQQWLKNNK